MTLSVLISCMNQTHEIVQKSNVQTDCIVINQCDHEGIEQFSFRNKNGQDCKVQFISTTDRGLSKSRNMAIAAANTDICLLCDDDEILEDDYENKILEAYENHPEISIAAFNVNRKDSRCHILARKKISFRLCLKLSSVQITFKRQDILEHRISFDEKIGSGTGNGPGEENGFLLSCRRQGLIGYVFPELIAMLTESESNWFKGYDEKYFVDNGYATKRTMGEILAMIYLIYWLVSHYTLYSKDMNICKAFCCVTKGVFQKR